MSWTIEEKQLLERLANGELDGRVGDDFVTGSYKKVYYWKYIKDGVPVSVREGESTRFSMEKKMKKSLESETNNNLRLMNRNWIFCSVLAGLCETERCRNIVQSSSR